MNKKQVKSPLECVSGGKEGEMSLALHFHRYEPPTLKADRTTLASTKHR